MSIEKAFLDSLGIRFFHGQNPQLLLNYNKDPDQGPPSLAHLKATDYLEKHYISKELYQSYFKFSFVRNPWARMVSIYRYFEYHRFLNFEDFLLKVFPKIQEKRAYFVGPQYDYIYNDNGDLQVDFVGRFENLNADFAIVQNEVDFSVGKLQHINKKAHNHKWYNRWNLKFVAKQLKKNPEFFSKVSFKQLNDSHYTEYYNEHTLNLVSEIYRKDVECFNYKFGD